jgi:ADP-heptose:LPS heptosyltransferase
MSAPSFLIVRFSAIGDCVMAVPVASRIRRSMPEARIAWVIERRCADVLDRARLVSQCVELPWDLWKRRKASPAVWREQLRTYSGLRRQRFDYGLDLQGHSKTALCLRLAAPKRRLTLEATDPLSKMLSPSMNRDSLPRHQVERNLAALEALIHLEGVAEPIMPELGDDLRRLGLSRARQAPLATIAVSAGSPQKAYPVEGWTEVANALLKAGLRVAALGGPGDPLLPVPQVTDLVGRLRLRETMAWVASSAVHIAADTGTGHIAAAYGVPVVSIFGPTDPSRFRPYAGGGPPWLPPRRS